jgi:hypothetical protein
VTAFRSQQVSRLFANFVPLDTPQDYAVFNDKDAVVGQVLADGVVLELSADLDTVSVCFTGAAKTELAIQSSIRFETFGLATADAAFERLLPAEYSDVYVTDTGDICANLTNLKAGKTSLYPIRRLPEWKQVQRTFNTTSLGVIYTLAVLFLVSALVVLARLLWDTRRLGTKVSWMQALLLFVFFFNIGEHHTTPRLGGLNQRSIFSLTKCKAKFSRLVESAQAAPHPTNTPHVLHSAFILAVALIEEPHPAFSFIGLVVTEIAPSLYSAWAFRHHKSPPKPSGIAMNNTRGKLTTFFCVW